MTKQSAQLQYDILVANALRGIVRHVLEEVVVNGLPGTHHFYITFRTQDADVLISPWLKAKYNPTMTIVLQNQFWNLVVKPEFFSVNLSFNGKMETLKIPFTALVSFADPSVNFGLQFVVNPEAVATSDDKNLPSVEEQKSLPTKLADTEKIPSVKEQQQLEKETHQAHNPGDTAAKPKKAEEPKVVSLDQFRKKNNK